MNFENERYITMGVDQFVHPVLQVFIGKIFVIDDGTLSEIHSGINKFMEEQENQGNRN